MRVTAEFESGNVAAVDVVSDGHVRVAARADGSPRPLWFYFAILGATVPAVRVDLVNSDECLGPRYGWRTVRPVFSADGVVWQRVVHTRYVEKSSSAGYFSFTVPVVGARTRVAFCYPYTITDLDGLIQRLVERPSASVERLCLTPEGRSVPLVRIGPTESAAKGVWIVARQHAGESPASFTAEGLMLWLSSEDPRAADARRDVAFRIAPMLDPDGVFHGRYGKDEAPVDLNRDWTDQPQRSTTGALVQSIDEWARLNPYDLFLDLHAPHPGDTSCYLFGSPPAEADAVGPNQRRFMELLAQECPSDIGLRAGDLRTEPSPTGSARQHQFATHGVLALTVEMSYHLAQSGQYLTPDDYRAFGSALGRTLHRYLHGT